MFIAVFNGVKPVMRVFLKKTGAIHDMEGRIAFMRNNLKGLIRKNIITKMGKKIKSHLNVM